MKYFYTKSSKQADAIAAAMADSKRAMVIFTGAGDAIEYSATGERIAETRAPRHFDAVEVWPDMAEKQRRQAGALAAGRETVRTREERAAELLPRAAELTREERAELLQLVKTAYHDSGKIEGIYSIDGTASCEFCSRMRAAAEDNILIICGDCYAAADSYKEFSWRAHKLNALILSTVLFTVEELQALPVPDGERVRFNEDGDTINQIHAQNYLRIAAGRPAGRFGYFYKNAPAVEAGLIAEGYKARDALPDNIRFIHSSLLIGFPAAALWFDDAIFTVYPDDATTAAAVAAGSHECNGRRCRACGFTCYLMQRRPEPLHIAEYLRCGKAARAAKLDAYNARKAAQAARAC